MSQKQLQLGEDELFLALQNAWERVLEALADQVNKPTFESWIKPVRPLGIDENLVRLGTNSRMAKQLIESKHIGHIKQLLSDELGFSVNLRVELLEGDEPAFLLDKLPKKPKPQKREDEEPVSLPLNTQYNFDNFVVGPNNRLAEACARAIAEQPGRTYNPLFLYGGPGLGKTHLMHAIGQYAKDYHPALKIAYISGETFTYHYITALREHRAADFRKRYRSVDIWLVDDIQFLVGKERTEEEFFHTYNAIYDMGKQIVLSSDRAPKELELDTRLLSRFEMGMLTDIAPPDLETRMAILEKRAQLENMVLSHEVVTYIARLITSDIRRLQSALIRLHAYSSLMKEPVTTGLAEQVLGEYYTDQAPPAIDVQKIQDQVAKKFNIELSELKGKCRSKDIVVPRQVAMYLTRELTDTSLPAIGKVFGGRDHTTVLHACRKIEAQISNDKNFASLVDEVTRLIRNGNGR